MQQGIILNLLPLLIPSLPYFFARACNIAKVAQGIKKKSCLFPLQYDYTTWRGVGRWTLRSYYNIPEGGKQRVSQKSEFLIFLLIQYMEHQFVVRKKGSEGTWSVL